MDKLISIREYARQCGCSDTAIHKAIQSGKIVKGLIREAGWARPKINPKVANAEWGKNYNPDRIRNHKIVDSLAKSPQGRETAKALGIIPPSSEPRSQEKPPVDIPDTDPPPQQKISDANLAKVRLKKEAIKAMDAELSYKRKLGTMVDKEQVYKTLYAVGKEIRQVFEALPDQFIDEILAQPTRNESMILLKKIIREQLERIANLTESDIQP